MLAVMRQKRQAEEDERRAKEKREARAAWLKASKHASKRTGCGRGAVRLVFAEVAGGVFLLVVCMYVLLFCF